MRYAILSDIHANESALRHVLADAAAQRAEQIVSLGDAVGYGPLPVETLQLIRRAVAVSLCGNHDAAVSGRSGSDDFVDLAADAVRRHRSALGSDDLAWLKSLPYTCELKGALASHGDFVDPPRFNYVDDEATAARNFAANAASLMFVGHTHEPSLFLTGRSGAVYRLPPQDFVLEDGKRYIVNPGSVGIPRETDGLCRSSYVLYDSVARTVTFRFLPFAVSSVLQRGRPPRFRRGVWLSVGVAATLASIALVASFASRSAASEPVAPQVTRLDDDSVVLAQKNLTLRKNWRSVRANLKLQGRDASVVLRVVFKSASGEVTGEILKTVMSSSIGKIAIPKESLSAHFTVSGKKASDSTRIRSFAPLGE